MITPIRSSNLLALVVAIAFLLLTACATSPNKPEGAAEVRNKLLQLQANPQLASRAPVAIKEAEAAVRTAEKPRKDKDLEQHLLYMADRKVDIAAAQAHSRWLEDQRKTMGEERERMRLDFRTREADQARVEAEVARTEADIARMDATMARQEADQLRELNAQNTERGMVVTLGDVLFDTGKADLKGGATSNLQKLAAFLKQYQDRTVIIEGHTDNVGSEDLNHGLSQRRADAVKSYLVKEGVDSGRLQAAGKGESQPVANNNSPAGRQQNRRVEVIIENPVATTLEPR
jgi:outer membrane protein OmpA-like peptidoglycan-associated protein